MAALIFLSGPERRALPPAAAPRAAALVDQFPCSFTVHFPNYSDLAVDSFKLSRAPQHVTLATGTGRPRGADGRLVCAALSAYELIQPTKEISL
ncbi:hypothetical protein EVAR_17849_1 [Eumeta japonica]|uniref:Uncharacterized protein n=1 Tax=Eumeta variegata TaxID=151549 RepID=A0A4C1TTQ6_EUMVA|nr:hypothetical protein EVAR_17849_1 [Eumeta japonica]